MAKRTKAKKAKKIKKRRARSASDPTVTINSDGTWSPSPVPINAGGVVKFEVNYPAGTTNCVIPFGTITFNSGPKLVSTGSGTVKVGSGG